MYKIITKVINKYEFNSKSPSDIENKKIIRADNIEDKDEYLVTIAIKIHEAQKINPNFNDKAKIMPK